MAKLTPQPHNWTDLTEKVRNWAKETYGDNPPFCKVSIPGMYWNSNRRGVFCMRISTYNGSYQVPPDSCPMEWRMARGVLIVDTDEGEIQFA